MNSAVTAIRQREYYRFGRFTLDATALVLLRDGQPIPIPKKAVLTLAVLVRSQGQVVTKEELLSAIWPERVVEDANLTQNIAVLRKALMASSVEPGKIETFPGRGYRILGPVYKVEEATAESAPSGSGADQSATVSRAASDAPSSAAKAPGQHRWRAVFGLVIAVGVSALWGAWQWHLRKAVQSSPIEYHRVPIAKLGGKEFQPAPSSDGSRVAFVWQQHASDPARIWVSDGTQAARMLTNGAGEFISPAWSPDDRYIACLHFENGRGEILIFPADGGLPRKVIDVFGSRHGLAYQHLAWSPDGSTLAFDDTSADDVPFSIFLFSLRDHSRTVVTRPAERSFGDVAPRFSPDGRKLSWIAALDRSRQELRVIDLESKAIDFVTADNRQILAQDWACDGKAIFFATNRSGDFRIWKARPGHALTPTALFADSPLQFAMARNKPVMVYSVLRQNFSIWKLDLRPNNDKIQFGWSPLTTSSAQDASPVLSRSDGRICFRSDRSGEEQLWVSSADGSNPIQVTHGSLRPSVGHWSHDEKSIVFHSANDQQIYIASENGSKWSVRPLGKAGIHPIFSADDRFVFAGEPNSIERFPVSGGAGIAIASFAGVSLLLSDDGRSLYYMQSTSDTSLWRLNLETQRVEKMLDGIVPYCSSCWTVSANGVYYLGRSGQTAEGQAIFFHGWKQLADAQVVQYPEPLNPIGSGPFSLTRDGRYLICVRAEWSNVDVIKVEPFD